MTTEELAWLAGIFEGEGWSQLRKQTVQGKWHGSWSLCLAVASTDFDVIESIHRITGVGRIDNKPNGKHKPLKMWRTQRREDILALIDGMWPFLHSRRREQLAPIRKHCVVALTKRPATSKLALPKLKDINNDPK